MAGATQDKKTIDLTTGPGVISFPRIFKETAGKNDKGETVYDLQFLIPKKDKATARAIMAAVKEVGEAKWGERWKQVRQPLRDADAEADDLTEDGSTKGEKYPERLGHWFINVRSKKPIGVVDGQRVPIDDHSKIYPGAIVKVAMSLYPYTQQGNNGIGAGLNGVQFVRDGEPIAGGGKPSVESMFDMLDDADDDLGLDDDLLGGDEPEAKPAKKAKGKAKGKKGKTKVADEDSDLADDLDDL